MGEQHANGWRVSRHRLVADATVGVIANPMSGRDIRGPGCQPAVRRSRHIGAVAPRRPSWASFAICR